MHFSVCLLQSKDSLVYDLFEKCGLCLVIMFVIPEAIIPIITLCRESKSWGCCLPEGTSNPLGMAVNTRSREEGQSLECNVIHHRRARIHGGAVYGPSCHMTNGPSGLRRKRDKQYTERSRSVYVYIYIFITRHIVHFH